MDCDICGDEIRSNNKFKYKNYSHYYRKDDDGKYYEHKYNDYSKSSRDPEYDVRVCSKHFIQNKSKINIHRYLHEIQPKRYLIGHLKKHFKICT